MTSIEDTILNWVVNGTQKVYTDVNFLSCVYSTAGVKKWCPFGSTLAQAKQGGPLGKERTAQENVVSTEQ